MSTRCLIGRYLTKADGRKYFSGMRCFMEGYPEYMGLALHKYDSEEKVQMLMNVSKGSIPFLSLNPCTQKSMYSDDGRCFEIPIDELAAVLRDHWMWVDYIYVFESTSWKYAEAPKRDWQETVRHITHKL